MTCQVLKSWWSDAGTFESLLKATTLVANKKMCECEPKDNKVERNTRAGASGQFGGPLKHSER